jgi:hypothetical protein
MQQTESIRHATNLGCRPSTGAQPSIDMLECGQAVASSTLPLILTISCSWKKNRWVLTATELTCRRVGNNRFFHVQLDVGETMTLQFINC